MTTKLKTALYLDDLRTPSVTLEGCEPFIVVRSYDEFVDYIKSNGIPDVIFFDHDLADEHMMDWYTNQAKGKQLVEYDSFKEKTGLDCIKWLCNLIQDEKENNSAITMPIIRVHSHNAVGSQNIYSYASSFAHAMDLEIDIRIMVIPFTIETKVE